MSDLAASAYDVCWFKAVELRLRARFNLTAASSRVEVDPRESGSAARNTQNSHFH